MNAHGHRRLTAETAEQLLSGRARAAHHVRRVADRLAMASAPAFPGELAGEDAAAAAFRAAQAPLPGRRSMTTSALVAKLLTLKAAVIAVAAVSAGGVALAASTGVLPNPLAPGHSTPTPAHTKGSDATPSPSLVGLCTPYLAGAGADHGKALESPAFSALVVAARGRDKVDAYCGGLGVTAPGSGRGQASDHRTGAPASHPGATDHPTAHPASTRHPTGEPSHPTAPGTAATGAVRSD
jgi:hypothetical protein